MMSESQKKKGVMCCFIKIAKWLWRRCGEWMIWILEARVVYSSYGSWYSGIYYD